MTITKEILNAKVEHLNAISNQTYDLYYAYGKVRLVKREEKGGISNVSEFGTKTEIANIITAIERYNYFEKK
jgi:hypothetical protein